MAAQPGGREPDFDEHRVPAGYPRAAEFDRAGGDVDGSRDRGGRRGARRGAGERGGSAGGPRGAGGGRAGDAGDPAAVGDRADGEARAARDRAGACAAGRGRESDRPFRHGRAGVPDCRRSSRSIGGDGGGRSLHGAGVGAVQRYAAGDVDDLGPGPSARPDRCAGADVPAVRRGSDFAASEFARDAGAAERGSGGAA